MSALFPFLISALAAASAALAAQGLQRLRQFQVARARALGATPAPGGLGATLREQRLSWATGLQKALPSALSRALQGLVDRADSPVLPGLLAWDMAAYAFAGFLLGLGLSGLGLALAGGGLGLALPFMRVRDAGQRRLASLRRELPDALDLLTACVEAGLGFDQALARVASRLKAGPLKKELEACVASMGIGSSRREALRELERRVSLEEMSQLVGALLQADKRGVPLGPALRSQSGQLRALRGLRVKKAAAEAPLKMLFPLMAFILPVVFIVLFGPIVLKWRAGGF